MKIQFQPVALKLAAAVACGILLRLVMGLEPVWWLVWLAPAPLLVIVIRLRPRDARWMVALASVIGASSLFHYLRLVMPLRGVLLALALEALVWTFLILTAGRVMARYQAWWTVFAFPALWTAFDTLTAALLPDGNWGSLAYSQGDHLVIFQTLSLFGTAGLVFLLGLVPSTLALALACGRTVRRGSIAYAVTALLLALSVLYGTWRLSRPLRGAQVTFGLVSIDDPIGVRSPAAYSGRILDEYRQRIAEVAAGGAQVVVLPEKVEMIAPANVGREQQRWSAAARQNHVWLEVGVGIDDGRRPTNWAWLFAPDGTPAASYEKHFMAPPERRDHYATGHDYSITAIGGEPYGLAICKDMHFAVLGRAYGLRHAAVMLVPAWDFAYLDGWIEARTTIARGVENGYSIVRASREGLLTVSDPYGRVLAEVPSSEMPGRTLLAKALITAQVPTLYTRIGNAFGWLCVVVAALFLFLAMRRRSFKPASAGQIRPEPLVTVR